jgi:hypothetical protein
MFWPSNEYLNFLISQLQPATLRVQVNRPQVVDYIEIEPIAKHLFQAPINEVHLHCEWQQQRKKSTDIFSSLCTFTLTIIALK